MRLYSKMLTRGIYFLIDAERPHPVSSAPPCKLAYLEESVNVSSPEMLWVFSKKIAPPFFSRAQVWPCRASVIARGKV